LVIIIQGGKAPTYNPTKNYSENQSISYNISDGKIGLGRCPHQPPTHTHYYYSILIDLYEEFRG